MKADAKTVAEVMQAIDTLWEHYERRDLGKVMACFAQDADTALIGTGQDEMRIGPAAIKEQVKRDWAQTEAIACKLSNPAVSAAGNVAWLVSNGMFEATVGGEFMTIPGRFTAVLERRNGQWLITQTHFSTPTSGQAQGESVPPPA